MNEQEQTSSKTLEEIVLDFDKDREYTFAEVREICEIQAKDGWQEEVKRTLKSLALHAENPILFSQIEEDGVIVDMRASRALQTFYQECLINYLNDGFTTDVFAARAERLKLQIENAIMEKEIELLESGLLDKNKELKSKLKSLQKRKRKT